MCVALLPHPADGALRGGSVQGVQRGLHGDVAGQPPQVGVAPVPQPEMPEDAVEQAVQVGTGQVPPVPAVGVQQPCGGVVECPAVGGKAAAVLPRGRGQCTERCR